MFIKEIPFLLKSVNGFYFERNVPFCNEIKTLSHIPARHREDPVKCDEKSGNETGG